eukprot:scaffold377372_cov15-Prasinocladus_malaysianus.AAC.1
MSRERRAELRVGCRTRTSTSYQERKSTRYSLRVPYSYELVDRAVGHNGGASPRERATIATSSARDRTHRELISTR